MVQRYEENLGVSSKNKKNMSLHLEKFKDKNKDMINQMNEFIDRNVVNKSLRLVMAGTSMFHYLKELEEVQDLTSSFHEMYKYRGVRVMLDIYHPDSTISYVMKENRAKFNIPCICGYFEDEPHGDLR